MKNFMITLATTALLFGGAPAMAQDAPTTSTAPSVTQDVPTAGPENETLQTQNPSTAPSAPTIRVEPPPVNVEVEAPSAPAPAPAPPALPEVDVNVESSAPAAPSVQVIERSAPVTQSTTKETTTTTKIVEDARESNASDVGLFVILGGLGLVGALALFASSYSRGNVHSVRRETVVH